MHGGNLELSLPDKHLVQFGKSLLALVTLKLGPELQVIIDQCECLTIVLGQFDLFPHLGWQVRSFNRLQEEVTSALLFANGCIACVGEGTGVTRAQTGQIVLVTTEGLDYGSDKGKLEG